MANQHDGEVNKSTENILRVIEPKYEGIPLGILRRMGKAVRMGVCACLPVINQGKPIDGLIIGTANGGMEDCIKFLNQVIQYDEGTLTPTNFVQSTPNAIAAQVALLSDNSGYNITHVHRGLAFENALLDAKMLLADDDTTSYLLLGIDEISSYNYNIDFLNGDFRKTAVDNMALYQTSETGTIAGEGVAAFYINKLSSGAVAEIMAVSGFVSDSEKEVSERLLQFLSENGNPKVDVLISGENGDNRITHFYEAVENAVDTTCVTRFKHFTGEYPTASSAALWLACRYIQTQQIPSHFIKRVSSADAIHTILVYNTYKGLQHSFMLISAL